MKRRLFYLASVFACLAIVSTIALAAMPKTAYAAPAAPPTGSDTLNPSACSEDLGAFDLDWYVCGIMDAMAFAVSGLDNFINVQMSIGSDGNSSDPNQIFCNSGSTGAARKSCEAYHDAWSTVRNLALGLMIIAGIVVLIAQALGMEILDAYTIRKVLPGFLIAALGITLSWQLMQFFVTLSNDLAFGVRYLIYQPFTGFENQQLMGGGTAAISTLLGFGALTALGWIGLLSFLGTALLAVFVAVLILILRDLIIVTAIIIAPIAIVMYILPNTKKLYKFWWESFSKALLMFALIAGLIASGRVFATLSSARSNSPIAQLAGFAAYFLPYFLIPATFKFAGGALRNIGGYVQDRSKGAFGGLRSYRGNVAKKNWGDLKTGNRLKGTNGEGFIGRPYSAFARRFNATSRTAAHIPAMGYNPNKWSERMGTHDSEDSTREAMEALEKNHHVAAIKADDDIVESALLYDTESERYAEMRRRGMTKERADLGVAGIRAAERSMSRDGFQKAMLVASMGTSSGWTPRYEKNAAGEDAWYDSNGLEVAAGTAGAKRRLRPGSDQGGAEWRELINKKLGNDRQGAIAVLGAGRQMAESKGRFDLVGGSFTEDAIMLEQHNPLQAGGRKKTDVAAWQHQILKNALDGQSRAKVLNGHNRSLEALAPVMAEQLREATMLPARPGVPAPSAEDAISQYAFAAGALDYASSSAPEMARHIKQQVLDQEVNVRELARNNPQLERVLVDSGFFSGNTISARIASGNPMVRNGEIMEHLRNTNADFGRYRREYGRATDADAAARARPPDGAPI